MALKNNKKGQAALVALAIGIFIFFLGLSFIDPLKDVITEARAVDQLDCANSSITDGAKTTCLIVDLILPYFIITILAIAGAWISARIVS